MQSDRKGIVYKKRVRLRDFDYKGCYRYFITLCTFNKRPLFADGELVNWLIRVLREKSDGFGFRIWAYCYMPDHLHLLIEGKNSDSDMKRFIASYKQFTGYYHRKEKNLSLWQVNFHEHVLRKDEDTKGVAYYIFSNPVRKGLVRDYREYKFLGSFEFDVAQP